MTFEVETIPIPNVIPFSSPPPASNHNYMHCPATQCIYHHHSFSHKVADSVSRNSTKIQSPWPQMLLHQQNTIYIHSQNCHQLLHHHHPPNLSVPLMAASTGHSLDHSLVPKWAPSSVPKWALLSVPPSVPLSVPLSVPKW